MFRRILVTIGSRGRSRMMSSEIPDIPRLSYAEVNKELGKKDTLLIDVREGQELIDDGKIKGSLNVPLGEVEAALKMDSTSFKKLYGFDKPEQESGRNLIVHCKAGVRAMKAAVVLSKEGYSNVKVYDGILDWLENGGQLEKR